MKVECRWVRIFSTFEKGHREEGSNCENHANGIAAATPTNLRQMARRLALNKVSRWGASLWRTLSSNR